MLVGGNLPPAGGEFMFGRGSNGTNRFRMEGTVNSYRRTSEKYELGLFLVFFFKSFQRQLPLQGAYFDSFFECLSFFLNWKEVLADDWEVGHLLTVEFKSDLL